VTEGRTVVVLAAGEGKRMKSAVPKVLHPLLGRTLLGHVLAAVGTLRADRTVVVVGHGADQVTAHIAAVAPDAVAVLQAEQRGTGHAARVAVESVGVAAGTVVIVNADVPLLRASTLAAFVESHESAGAAASVLTAEVTDPYGLGRIIRDETTGALQAVVEERDATPTQRAIREINAGVYAFDARFLGQALGKLTSDNDQGEEYLTDLVAILVAEGCAVGTHTAPDQTEVLGCNDRVELATLGALLRDRVNAAWMRAGVTIVDPSTTWIDVVATLDRDAVVEPGTQVRGRSSIGSGAVVGPDTTLIDVSVGDGAQVVRAHAVGATIGPRANVGPYAYLRPGTVLHEATKVGTFVEVKNSEVGAGTKIPHLSYVGDATIGEQTNIGAANVVVNYDGIAKHRTVVGSHVRTGSDTMLVAPVTVGDGAYTAAGSVVTKDVPAGALAVARSDQHNIEGWVEKRRPGTKAAAAAAAARSGSAGTHQPESSTHGATPATHGATHTTHGATPATHGAIPETRAALPQAASAEDASAGDTSSD
jgi:bifunctional UDP-N-acetylglucosamine pyrophosphorylase/glucosamine-1-phosphate N-acetyltransferase